MAKQTFSVYMLAFQSVEVVRPVEVDLPSGCEVEDLLDLVYHNGQNEVQPVPGCCSVSVGDVVEVVPLVDYFVVEPGGFKRLDYREFCRYCREMSSREFARGR